MAHFLNHQKLQQMQKKMAKVKTQARRMISSFDSLVVLENLVSCFITTCMWTNICAFYQHKSKENIYMVQNSFFEYKMNISNSINTHVNKVMSMENILKNLGQPLPEYMLITKIICSIPLS